jgi:hypothetical protein
MRFPLVLAFALVSGASHAQTFQEYLNDPKAPRIRAQVCIPDKTAFFDELEVDVSDLPNTYTLGNYIAIWKQIQSGNELPRTEGKKEFQTIWQWRPPRFRIRLDQVSDVRGSRSTGPAVQRIHGRTARDQAVFQSETRLRPGDLLALMVQTSVQRGGKEERRDFWFKPPQNIQAGSWTEWTSAISEEGENERDSKLPTWYRLVHGRETTVHPVFENAPRIRYTLEPLEVSYQREREESRGTWAARFRDLRKDRTIESKPAVEERPFFYLPRREAIPEC